MQITRAGERPSQSGNPDYFTGQVRLDPVAVPQDGAQVAALMVTFAPGARTAWHTHPKGQTIHVMSGLCLAQVEGGPVHELRPGDSTHFGAGVRHWHGAAPEVGMVHIAIQEVQDGSAADWQDHVTDAQYNGPRA